ncbi:MAG: PCYCGC motif-containing (lipo)protein [Acidobacteriota bacterium]
MQRLLVIAGIGMLVSGAALALAQGPSAASATGSAAQAAPRVSTPPIPNPGFAPGRPVDQARAVYEFAAQHPEILKYVPCYCGCETSGHPHNESCFVKSRDAKGNVTEWDTHGYG